MQVLGIRHILLFPSLLASVAQSDAPLTGLVIRSRGFDPHRVRQHCFVETDHEICFGCHSLPFIDSSF